MKKPQGKIIMAFPPNVLPSPDEIRFAVAHWRFPKNKKKRDAIMAGSKSLTLSTNEFARLGIIKKQMDFIKRLEKIKAGWEKIAMDGNHPAHKASRHILAQIGIVEGRIKNGRKDFALEISEIMNATIEVNKALLVPFANEGYESKKFKSQGGRQRKGKLSPFHIAIKRISEALASKDWLTIIEEIENDCGEESKIIEALRADKKTPLNIHFQETIADTETIYFSHKTRNGEILEDHCSIKRMKNILSKIPSLKTKFKKN